MCDVVLDYTKGEIQNTRPAYCLSKNSAKTNTEVRTRMTLVWNMAQSDGAISVFLIFKSLRQSHHTAKLFHTPMSTFVAIAVLSYSLYGIYISLHSVLTKQVDLNVRQCASISQYNKLPDIPIGHSFRLVIVPILLLHSSCSEKSPVG